MCSRSWCRVVNHRDTETQRRQQTIQNLRIVFLCVSVSLWFKFLFSGVFPMSETIERFQTRAELAQFIDEQAGSAVEKALAAAPQVERRVPWVTSGPVGQDSAGYSVLKAAAFALGFLGPEQAKEEIQVHQQLRELYQTY